MNLQRGMIIKFRDYIDCNKNFRNDEVRKKYLKRLEEIEGKIVTIFNVDSVNLKCEPRIEVNEFPGEYFPIEYFECIIPTIPIEIPKEYLKDNNIVELRNGDKLLYINEIFCKEFEMFCSLEDFTYNLEYKKDSFGNYDIVKIYKNYECKEVLWERK